MCLIFGLFSQAELLINFWNYLPEETLPGFFTQPEHERVLTGMLCLGAHLGITSNFETVTTGTTSGFTEGAQLLAT